MKDIAKGTILIALVLMNIIEHSERVAEQKQTLKLVDTVQTNLDLLGANFSRQVMLDEAYAIKFQELQKQLPKQP